MRKTQVRFGRLFLFFVLAAALAFSTDCARVAEIVRPQPTPTPTATPVALPAWQQPDAYRVAMLSGTADDVHVVKDPTFYYIRATFELEPEQPRIHAVQDTRYTNRTGEALDSVYFRLLPNKPSYGSALTFSEVTVAGQAATLNYTVENTAVEVVLGHALAAGEAIEVHMEYEVTVPVENGRGYGTFNYQDGILLASNFFPMVAVYQSTGWNLSLAPDYGDPVFSEASFFTAELTAPKEVQVITSGSTTGKKDNGDGTSTWECESGPMRDFMVVIGDRFESSSAAVGFIRVNSYYLPEHKQQGERILAYARDSLRAYQQSFGPYPFNELDVVEGPIYSGGMEYPGLVIVAEQYYPQGGDYFEFVAAHEVAHQWWYSLVGDDQVNTPWLDESLANFSTVYYYESTYDRGRADLVFQNYIASRYQQAKELGHDAAVNQPVAAYTPEDYGLLVYGKGAIFFAKLREQMGDEAMLAFLRAYLQNREYKISTDEDLLRVAEQTSGQDLQPLYHQWILNED